MNATFVCLLVLTSNTSSKSQMQEECFFFEPLSVEGTNELSEDMDRVKQRLVFMLSNYERYRLYNGMADPSILYYAIALTINWKEEEFIAPLLSILQSADDRGKFKAALSLLFYENPRLNSEVERYAKHEVFFGSADLGAVTRIQDLLDAKNAGRLWQFSDRDPERTEDLMAGLRSAEVKARHAAWAKLVRRGVVPAPRGILEDMALLSIEEKTEVLLAAKECHAPIVGANHLKRLLVVLCEDPALREYRPAIWASLYRLGHSSIYGVVGEHLENLLAELEKSSEVPLTVDAHVREMFSHPIPAHWSIYRDYALSKRRELSKLGWQAIVRVNSQNSVAMLRKLLREASPTDFALVGVVMQTLARLGRKRIDNRAVLLAVLYEAWDSVPCEGFAYASLIDAFKGISGIDFGSNGVFHPGIFDAGIAKATAKKCKEWYLKNVGDLNKVQNAPDRGSERN